MQSGYRTVWAFAIFNTAMVFLVLSVHFWPGNNSMLNLNSWEYMNPEKGLNEAYLDEVITYHQTEPTFARRPVTTQAVLALHRITGLTKAQSFVLFNFVVLWLTGIVICIAALFQTKNLRNALLSSLLYWLSFPVLFAFFPTIYSYDDPLLYLFLAMTLLSIQLGNQWSAAAMFALAIVSRESAVILLPGIMVLYNDGFKLANLKTSWKKWWPFLVVSLAYLAALVWQQYGSGDQSFSNDTSRRFATLLFNFQNRQFAVESIISAILVCSLPFLSWYYSGRNSANRRAFMLTLILNTLIVLVFTQARESRLFMLPLFFWFPLAGQLVLQKATEIIEHLRVTLNWRMALLYVLAIVGYWFMAFLVYQPTAMLPYENWHQEYLFVLLIFTALMPYAIPSKAKK
jgi:hypothetical protein